MNIEKVKRIMWRLWKCFKLLRHTKPLPHITYHDKILKPGLSCKDILTGLQGHITHTIIPYGGSPMYHFRPSGLNSQGRPHRAVLITPAQIGHYKNGETVSPEEKDYFTSLLGTKAKEKYSGFQGRIIAVVLHQNGCMHIQIQPPGKNGEHQEPLEFDLRDCTGEQIKKITAKEKSLSLRTSPSPISTGNSGAFGFRPII